MRCQTAARIRRGERPARNALAQRRLRARRASLQFPGRSQGAGGQWREKVAALAQRLIRTAAAHDCTTVEINPLVKLADGAMIAADAKIALDEWAAFRNSRIYDECEAQKQRADPYLRACLDMQHMYVHLDGGIGVISGGAGMTMAAMDMIAEYGGRPACFLDCSPGPTSTRGYRPAFAMLDADPAVKVILVTVF